MSDLLLILGATFALLLIATSCAWTFSKLTVWYMDRLGDDADE